MEILIKWVWMFLNELFNWRWSALPEIHFLRLLTRLQWVSPSSCNEMDESADLWFFWRAGGEKSDLWYFWRAGGESADLWYFWRAGGESADLCYFCRAGGESADLCYFCRAGGESADLWYFWRASGSAVCKIAQLQVKIMNVQTCYSTVFPS